MTILLTGTRAPATLDLARRLWREGVRVIGADSLRYPLGKFSQAIGGQAERFDLFARLRHHEFPGGGVFRTPTLALAMWYQQLRDLW